MCVHQLIYLPTFQRGTHTYLIRAGWFRSNDQRWQHSASQAILLCLRSRQLVTSASHPVEDVTRTIVYSITVLFPLWWGLYWRRGFCQWESNSQYYFVIPHSQVSFSFPAATGSSDTRFYLPFPLTYQISSLFLLILLSTLHIPFLVLFKTSKAVIQQPGEKRFDETHLLLRPCWPGSFTFLFLSPVSCSNKSSAALKAINTEMTWAITRLDNSKDFQ